MSKEKALTLESIKEAILPPVAQLFEYHAFKTEEKFKALDEKIEKGNEDLNFILENMIDDKIHGVKILMEQTDKKIDLALELGRLANDHSITIDQHSQRLSNIEREIRVIKKVIRTPEI